MFRGDYEEKRKFGVDDIVITLGLNVRYSAIMKLENSYLFCVLLNLGLRDIW